MVPWATNKEGHRLDGLGGYGGSESGGGDGYCSYGNGSGLATVVIALAVVLVVVAIMWSPYYIEI